jgi:hypothetical protein
MGLELLRPFAFIAPVPRPDDYGIDAVGTLFRRDGKRLIAEDSFLVQVKLGSVRQVTYKGDQLRWLRALTLPFFWMSVDLHTMAAELWPLNDASYHPNFMDWEELTLYLGPRQFKKQDEKIRVCLSKPALKWTATDAVDPTFQERFYKVLKAWVSFAMRCIAVRRLGMNLRIEWETNEEPKPFGGFSQMIRPGERRAILEESLPHIQTLTSLSLADTMNPNVSDDTLTIGLILVSEYMRKEGVDPDPNGVLPGFLRMKHRMHESKNAEPSGSD